MIKGIIFDFDGLTFDTETPEYTCWKEIFAEHNAEFPLELWRKGIGTIGGFSPYTYLIEQIDKKIDQELIRLNFSKRLEEILSEGKPRPGVEKYLNDAKKLQLKIGLASSSTYSWVSGHLNNLNLYKHFECIKTADHVEKVKPDPSLYIEAAKCLGIAPEQCLAFEDSVNGSLAAI